MQSISTFCTDRLVAKRLCVEDLNELYQMHHDPRVMATLGGLRSDDQTQQFLIKREADVTA